MPDPSLVPMERIERAILVLRGRKVMLDADLAAMYGVETKALVRAVKRNEERFPSDFMFQLSLEGSENLRYQNGTSSSWGGRRYLPYAFTEQGVAMLSSVLRSRRAAQVNVAIMRAFVRLREALTLQAELAAKLADLERKIAGHDESIRTLFEAIRQLMVQPGRARRPIGFRVEEGGPVYRVRRLRRAASR
jgi:phage regulator Rha-like protein